MVMKHHQDIISKEQKGVKMEELRMKRLAKTVANEIKKFWSQIEKVLNYKQQMKLEEQKRKEMDKHLDFLVGQTEKYSEMLAKDLGDAAKEEKVDNQTNEVSEGKQEVTEMEIAKNEELDEKKKVLEQLMNEEIQGEDEEEYEVESEEDDETTITAEDENVQSVERPEGVDESKMLENESMVPIEEIMKDYLDREPSSPMEESTTEADTLDNAANAAKAAQPTGFTLNTTTVKTKVPFLIRGQLREYQHIGLDWLVTMYHKKLNGILADEMGLGKTLMTISMLAYLACEKQIWGPHLIIVPTSLILNWELELKKWCPAFKVLTYYGSVKERKQKRIGWSKPNSFHVCITSYKLAIQDHAAFKKREWKYLILDEAHHIKNFKSKRWQVLLSFNSERRLLLTGTPLQNDLMELWSLMHFLMPHIFQSHSEFKDWFSNPVTSMIEGESDRNEEIITRLHGILRPFLLRRLKSQVEKQLPPKFTHVVPCKLSKRQRFLYEEFMQQSATRDTLSSGNFMGIVNVLMQLRKVCNHPDLFEVRPIVSSFDQEAILYWTSSLAASLIDSEEMQKELLINRLFGLSSSESSFSAARTLELKATSPQFIEAICQAPVANPLIIPTNSSLNAYKSRLEETKKLSNLQFAERTFQLNEVRCGAQPTFGTNLLNLLSVVQPTDIYRSPANSDQYLSSTHALEDSILLRTQRISELQPIIQNFTFCIPKARAPPPQFHCSHPVVSSFQQNERFTEELSVALAESATPFREQFVRTQIYFPDKRLIQYDCGKLQQMDLLLRQLKSGGHKCLIFTQMTRMLDILEIFLNIHGYTYVRLDGSTKVEQRQMLMERFNRDPKIFLFILSTRSGGIGVNLTGADTVIFYDSDWNPAMDAQAQDRCHRIGQTREVHIYRLISEYTIEENILKKSDQKRQLDDLVISGGSFTTDFFKKLDLRELIGDSSIKPVGNVTESDWVKAISSVEENSDRMALKVVQEEQASDVQEFKEDQKPEKKDDSKKEADDAVEAPTTESNEAENPDEEIDDAIRRIETTEEETTLPIEDQLTPIQRYMFRHLEAEKPLVVKVEEMEVEAPKDEEEKREEDEMLYYEVNGRSSIEVYIGALRDSIRRNGDQARSNVAARIYGPPNPDIDELYIPPLDDCEWMGMYSSFYAPPSASPPSMFLNNQFFSSSLIPAPVAHFLNSSSSFSAALEKQRNSESGTKQTRLLLNSTERALGESDKLAANYRRERLESMTAASISASIFSQEIGDEAKPAKKKRKDPSLETSKYHKKKKDLLLDEIPPELQQKLKKKDKKKKKEKKEKKEKKNKKDKKEQKLELLEDKKNKKKGEKEKKKKGKKAEAEAKAYVEYVAPWTIDEDLALLETKKKFGTNWDLISDSVSSIPRVIERKRGKKQCLDRWKILSASSPFNEDSLITSFRENLESAKPNGISAPRPPAFSIMDMIKKNAIQMKKKSIKNEGNFAPLPPPSSPSFRTLRTPTDLVIMKLQRIAQGANTSGGMKVNPGGPNVDKMMKNQSGLPVHIPNSNRGAGPGSSNPMGKSQGNKFSMDSTIGMLGPGSSMDAVTLARAMKNPSSFSKENPSPAMVPPVPSTVSPGTSVILNSNNSQMSRLAQINQSMTPHRPIPPSMGGMGGVIPPSNVEVASSLVSSKGMVSPTKSNPPSSMGPVAGPMRGAGPPPAPMGATSAQNRRPAKVKQSAVQMGTGVPGIPGIPGPGPNSIPTPPSVMSLPQGNPALQGGIPPPIAGVPIKANPKKAGPPQKNSGPVVGPKASITSPKGNPNYSNKNMNPMANPMNPTNLQMGVPPAMGLPPLPTQANSASPLSTLLVLYSMNNLTSATAPAQEIAKRKDLSEPQKIEELKKLIKDHASRRASGAPMAPIPTTSADPNQGSSS
eukprot:TRINITY_DN1884_c0_g1_i1.p1 TRINITY_DN1884_c0_g1~~TRINITY_DN1884_c0_g1_i1.p1  ORF type:complete len:2185 (-),score=786.74 TRINITY_DN1884_c0_g1_i1:61-5742(-)